VCGRWSSHRITVSGVRFEVLGPLAVWTSGDAPVTIPGIKVRALLADLLVHEGRAVSADRLIDDLWDEHLPRNPAGALHVKVSQLRRAFDDAEPGARGLVESGPFGYRLRADPEAVDARRFAARTAEARERLDVRARAALLTEALALWRGAAYAEFADEEFARGAITRLEEQRLTAVEDLAEARLQLGEHAALVGELGDLVARHPLRERLRAAQLRALYWCGRQAEALDSYEQLRQNLSDELGLDPGPELVRLHRAILRQDPELRSDPVSVTSIARPTTNLPARTSTEPDGGLVGRTAAISDVRALLGASRLVTLIGPGGVGKTRLAIEAARAVADDCVDGGWIVELATQSQHLNTIDAVDSIADSMATVLGIRAASARGLPDAGEHLGVTDRLVRALRSKQLLLVLDNCEHVIEPVALLAERLLAAAPGLRVLATSQEPLGLAGETTMPVLPLESPDVDTALDELERFGAVRLFVTRAASAAPGFVLSPDNAASVVEICRRLDGIPLALELAAARVRALDVRELARRLDERFRLLTAGHRTAPQRQQTLRATIDWSWDLLPPAERVVLRRLAVHAGGCTLDAVEHVCADADIDAADVLDVLARLVDRSLVAVVDDEGTRRYRLLESVAAYCLERLDEAGESAAVLRRHAEHYADVAQQAERELRGPGQREWLHRLDVEAANLRIALDSAADLRAPDLALRLVNSLGWYWFLRGRYQEARRSLTLALETSRPPIGGDQAPDGAYVQALTWLAGVGLTDYEDDDPAARQAAVLELHDDLDEPSGRAQTQWLCAFTMLGSGDMAVSERLASDALAGFRKLGDRWGVAAALLTRAEHALVQGDLAVVRRDSEDSLELFSELGDRWGQVHTTHLLATLAEVNGDYEHAVRLHQDALRHAEELELWPVVSTQLASLGRLFLLAGNLAEAGDYHRRAHSLAEEQSYGAGVAFAATGLAIGARRQGRFDVAEGYLRDLLDWNRRTGYLPGMALVLAELGFVAEQRGDAESARSLHTQGLAAARETGDARAVALALEGLAGVSVLTGEHDHAARLLGGAAASRASVGVPLPPAERGDVDRIAGRARATLGERSFAAAFKLGSEMNPDELP
jgi:predicted ATPase/DNA-binding SARP family transcriptional activator